MAEMTRKKRRAARISRLQARISTAEMMLIGYQNTGQTDKQEEITKKLEAYYTELQALQRKEANEHGNSEIQIQG